MTSTGDVVPVKPLSSRLTEGLFLAGIPVVLYVYTRAYEEGVAAHFGFPRQAIAISLNSLLNTTPLLLLGYGCVAFMFFIIPPFLLILLFRLAVLIGLPFVIFNSQTETWQRVVFGSAEFLMLGMIVLEVLEMRRLWKEGKDKPPSEPTEPLTMEAIYEGYGVTLNPLITTPFGLHPKRDLRSTMFLGLLFVGWLGARGIGERQAQVQTDFLVRPGQPEVVALRRYDNYWVCAVLDRQHHSVTSQFLFVEIPNSTTVWQYQRLGPLARQFSPNDF